MVGVLTTLSLFAFALLPVSADTFSINFEPSTYTSGNINGQDGWTSTGPFDQGVVTSPVISGSQSFRLSNAVTSGSFGDQTFSKSLVNEAGEVDSTGGGMSGGTRQSRFEAQFDFKSTLSAQQPGLAVSVSPDRGDGSRMSYLRFVDDVSGIDVFFDDVSGTTSPVSFDETQVANDLSRTTTHTAKFVIDYVDGPSNDVVKIYIDGILVKTGTTWENYYRFDAEASAEQTPRTTDDLIFRAGGTAAVGTLGNGFLFDNLIQLSGPAAPALVGPPTTFAECKGVLWKTFNNPTFTTKSKCEKYVKDHMHTIKGNDVIYTAYGLKREADLDMNTGDNAGSFEYDDTAKGWYNVKVSSVKVDGNQGWFAGRVVKASNPAWVGLWLFGKVQDNGPDKVWGSFTDQATAEAGVQAMSVPADGPFNVTKKNIKVD